MIVIPDSILKARDEYCRRYSSQIDENGEFWWGLDAFLWQSTGDSILKVHRYEERFRQELAVYNRLTERGVERLKGFRFPQLLHYDEELQILELSFVSPPYILDFVEVGIGKMPGNFDLDRIEAQQSKQFGKDWPDVRRLLEALMQIGIYYDDVHNKNIRLR